MRPFPDGRRARLLRPVERRIEGDGVMPPLPRRDLLLALGMALAATGAGSVFGTARALAAMGAAPVPEDVTRPPGGYPHLFGSRESATEGLLKLMPKAAVLRRSLAGHGGAAGASKEAARKGTATWGEAAGLVPAAAGGTGHGEPSLARWTSLLADLDSVEPTAQLVAVNRFVNAVPYISDRRNYRIEDYWATPVEFFAAGGDCEDFALAKFVSLRRLGFHEDRLRIAIVFDEQRHLQHAFLAVYLAGDIYVLDNQIADVTSHRRISHYRPICSFDSRRLWIHAS